MARLQTLLAALVFVQLVMFTECRKFPTEIKRSDLKFDKINKHPVAADNGLPAYVLIYPKAFGIFESQQEYVGGVLINSQTILTMASLLENTSPDTTLVKLGLQKENGGFSLTPHTIERNVSKIIIHPYYNQTTKLNDIALVYLKHKVPLNRHIQIASLPDRSAHLPRILRPMVYGIVAETYDGSLLVAFDDNYNLIRLDNNDCKNNNSSIYDPVSQFCATFESTLVDANPIPDRSESSKLVYVKKIEKGEEKNIIVGLLSSEDTPSKPLVYTRISYFVDWINQNL